MLYNCFKSVICRHIYCPQDQGDGPIPCEQGGHQKPLYPFGRPKWMAPYAYMQLH